MITFEEWIISRGIIASFPDLEIRKTTKLKAKKSLESAQVINNVLTKLASSECYIFEDDFFENDKNLLEEFFYIISFSNFQLLEVDLIVLKVKEILKLIDLIDESALFYLDKLLKHISTNKHKFLTEKEKEYFSLSSSSIGVDSFSENETKYLQWCYVEILISQKLSMHEHINIICGQLLRFFTKVFFEIKTKEQLLFNAYKYFENYQNAELTIPFIFENGLVIKFEELDDISTNDFHANESWDDLDKLFNQNESFLVKLTKKSKNGYEAYYKGLKGFLPSHHIKNAKLKKYNFEDSNFTINSKCLSISKFFNFFIIEQTDDSICENNFTMEVDKMYDAIVVGIENYGLFLSTRAGDGLLHINDLFDSRLNKSNLKKYFKKGQNIKVVLSEISEGNRRHFNFFKVKLIEPHYYNDFLENLFLEKSNDFEYSKDIEKDTYFERALNEKAFCIEQFAVLQSDLNKKLHNFQIAKQFYTNAKNARSFLLNVYIAYFEILLKIKETLHNSNLINIIKIKENAQEVKNKINKKTIDVFPDSDKLIFFLDIVSMFNEKGDLPLELLFDYIKKYSNDAAHKDLRTIAKITLANNLLISESEEDSAFILKNLRLIFDYLSNGILSLKESIEDKNARELKEEILYWQEKIKEDESETLEFKSSFYTPILNEERIVVLQKLKTNENKSDKVKLEIDKIEGVLAQKSIIHSALKTLVAFANSGGGTLLIGVDNNKYIIGLENEYKSKSPKLQYPNRDGFGLYFDEMVRDYIGDSISSLMKRKFLKFPEGDILIIKIESSLNEVFLLKNEEGKNCEQLYIRNLSSSKELTGSELVKFIKNKHLTSNNRQGF